MLPPLSSLATLVARSTLEIDDELESLPQANPAIEMVICSFALHLVESPSELFSLLWELSLKSRWLVVSAPHKRPEVHCSLRASSRHQPGIGLISCAGQKGIGLV
jgi:hypothetical protein